MNEWMKERRRNVKLIFACLCSVYRKACLSASVSCRICSEVLYTRKEKTLTNFTPNEKMRCRVRFIFPLPLQLFQKESLCARVNPSENSVPPQLDFISFKHRQREERRRERFSWLNQCNFCQSEFCSLICSRVHYQR